VIVFGQEPRETTAHPAWGRTTLGSLLKMLPEVILRGCYEIARACMSSKQDAALIVESHGTTRCAATVET